MKNFMFLVFVILAAVSSRSYAEGHSHHVKHNMVIFGTSGGFYASHIVYKVPHNYQVILKVNLDPIANATLSAELSANPNEQFIYLLDQMNIADLQQTPRISGQVFRRAADGTKSLALSSVILEPGDYSIIYFNELPLSLGADDAEVAKSLFENRDPLQCAKDDERPFCCRATSSCRPRSKSS